MSSHAMTMRYTVRVMLTATFCLALNACERERGPRALSNVASGPSMAGGLETHPNLVDTVGGPGIVADTTFSTGIAPEKPATPLPSPDADGLIPDEPTSTGIPSSAPATASRNVLVAADAEFLTAAYERSTHEAALSRLGFNKAKEPEIKLYAQTLLKHHLQVAEQLRQLAITRGVVLVEPPSAAQARGTQGDISNIDQLHRLSPGLQFDAVFLELAGPLAQKRAIALFDEASTHVNDPSIKAFARAKLPVMREHLRQAEALQEAKAGSSSAGLDP